MDKMVSTKWYGQNGMDKMVWTKWYVNKMVWTKWYVNKMVWTKWYGQNGMDKMECGQNGIGTQCYWTDKMIRINWYTDKISHQTINMAPTDNTNYFINPASTLTSLGFLFVFITL